MAGTQSGICCRSDLWLCAEEAGKAGSQVPRPSPSRLCSFTQRREGVPDEWALCARGKGRGQPGLRKEPRLAGPIGAACSPKAGSSPAGVPVPGEQAMLKPCARGRVNLPAPLRALNSVRLVNEKKRKRVCHLVFALDEVEGGAGKCQHLPTASDSGREAGPFCGESAQSGLVPLNLPEGSGDTLSFLHKPSPGQPLRSVGAHTVRFHKAVCFVCLP